MLSSIPIKLDISLNKAAESNNTKLLDGLARGKIQGGGDG